MTRYSKSLTSLGIFPLSLWPLDLLAPVGGLKPFRGQLECQQLLVDVDVGSGGVHGHLRVGGGLASQTVRGVRAQVRGTGRTVPAGRVVYRK